MADHSPASVARNLTLIEDMAARLEARAISQGHRVGTNDDRGIVGGEAMVALAGVGSLATWSARVDALEQAWREDPACDDDKMPNWSEYEDTDDLWSPFQILWSWSEQARIALDAAQDDPHRRATLVTEAKFLANADVAAWLATQPFWSRYAADIADARTKLETILVEGDRSLRGVPCMYEECRGKRLVRKLKPKYVRNSQGIRQRARDRRGHGLYEWDDWHCPRCHRTWSGDEYTRMVTAAHERVKFEDLVDPLDPDHVERWCSYDYAAGQVGRPESTIRVWVHRAQNPERPADHAVPIATACMIAGRRIGFVLLEDIRARDRLATRRSPMSPAGGKVSA